jgi:hypothetical protein
MERGVLHNSIMYVFKLPLARIVSIYEEIKGSAETLQTIF